MFRAQILITVFALSLMISAASGRASNQPAPSEASEKDAAATKKTTEGETGTPLLAFYKDGFRLETPDRDFQLRIQGNIHFDFRGFDGASGAPNGFDMRRSRFDFQGVIHKYYSFRLQAELADSPYIRNAWVDIGYVRWLHLRLGQMKPPFSTLWLTTDNNVNFIERAASTPLSPFFDRGVLIWGPLFGNTLTWNAGVWNGSGIDADYKKGDIDDHKDVAGRLFWSPFANSGRGYLKNIHFCVEGTYGAQSIPTSRFESALRAPDFNSNYWNWTDRTMAIDNRTRYGAEIHWVAGPWLVSSEWLDVRYDGMTDTEGAYRGISGNVTSWTVWSSIFVTGEGKAVDNFGWKSPAPRSKFDPAAGDWGAWEILARYTRTDTDRTFFDNGILDGASRADEYTAGINWTLNKKVKIQFNYVLLDSNGLLSGANSDQWIATEKGKKRDREDAVLLRFIFSI